MVYCRKFSLFISSTYEDLKEERKALMEVALDNNFIPVGMEQFYGEYYFSQSNFIFVYKDYFSKGMYLIYLVFMVIEICYMFDFRKQYSKVCKNVVI